jgi:hypothetical protein
MGTKSFEYNSNLLLMEKNKRNIRRKENLDYY